MLTTTWTSSSCSFFWYIGGKPDNNSYSFLNRWNKNSTGWANFSGAKSLFGTSYQRIRIALWHHIVSPEIIYVFWHKNALHGYSQSDYHLIYQSDIHRSYLIYFQVCNMLRILRNKSYLKQCIFKCRMLHLTFTYNDRFLIFWKYLVYCLVVC